MPQAKLHHKTETTPAKADAVAAFLLLLKDGIEAWQTAGALLVEMRKDKPGIYAEIIRREPLITVDMLETIERLGRKELHPQLLLNSQLPVKRLMGFPYDEQSRLCSDPVDVVVKVVSGKPTVHRKLVRDMSRLELKRALDTNRIRTVAEQAKLWGHNEGNEAWQKMSAAPVKPARLAPPAPLPPPKPAAPVVTTTLPQPAAATANLICIGRWAVRQSIGNNVGFERTNAVGANAVRIILDDGTAVIEVCRRK